jgi:hypothetical protein
LLLYGLAWRSSAVAIKRRIFEWAADQREAGVALSYTKLSFKGFPFFLRGMFDNVSIEARDGNWRTARVYIDMQPIAPRRLILSAPQAHMLQLANYRAIEIKAPDGRVSFQNSARSGWVVDLQTGALKAAIASYSIRASQVLLRIAPSAKSPLFFDVSFSASHAVFGLDGSRSQPADLEAMLTFSIANACRPYAVEIERLELVLPHSSAEVSGKLSIVPGSRMDGALDAAVSNPGAIAEFLGRAGALAPNDAETAAATLTLAAISKGGKIEGPLELRDGDVRFAGARIARF